MVKDKDYSAQAIIGRAQQQADVRKQEFESLKKQAQPQEEEQSKPDAAIVKNLGEKQVYQPVTSDFQTSAEGDTWNYKGAKTDRAGKPLQSRNFLGFEIKPQGFDPLGNPYFGAGGKAWLQKWAYKVSEEAASVESADEAWKKFAETSQKYSNAFFGKEKLSVPEKASLFLQGATQLFDASVKSIESAETRNSNIGFTPTTYALRAVNAAVGMTLEALAFVSEIPERVAGAERAMRDYSTENGSLLPSLTFDRELDDAYYERINSDPKMKAMYNPENGFKANSEAADFLSRLIIAPLQVYDAVRFMVSPGSMTEKKQALQNGWTEGRMLYTELLKDSVKAEYQSRVKAGEDAFLLTMELEDPWIEAAGEIIFDPLNFVGALGKSKKAGQLLDEAGRAVERNGLWANPEFPNLVKQMGNLTNDAEGSKMLDNVTDMVMEQAKTAVRQAADYQQYKAMSYTPEANKIVHRKRMGDYMAAVIQGIRNNGGTPDEVSEYLNAIRKLGSTDRAVVKEGLAAMSHMPLQTLAYNDSAFELGYMMNRIIDDKNFIKDMQKLGGNFEDLNKYLDEKITKGMDYMFPSVKEMSQAAGKLKAGETLDANTKRLADKFTELKSTHPGYVKWAQFQDFMDGGLRGLNGFLANGYFSLSYGYAARNLMQNMVTLFIDDGVTFVKGALKYDAKSGIVTPGLDDMILKFNGGRMPDQFVMKQDFVSSVTEGSFGGKFFGWLNNQGWSPAKMSQAFEVYSGKMIYAKKYRESYDNIAKIGGMFPEVAQWTKGGYTAEEANDFVEMFRANLYDVNTTFEQFAKKYGDGRVDKWRVLDWVQPEAKQGLKDLELWDDVVRMANDPNSSYNNILDKIDEMKVKVRQNANKVASEPVRVNDADELSKMMMEDGSAAGKFQDAPADNALNAIRLEADKALGEFRDALTQLYRKSPDVDAQQIFDVISEQAHVTRRQAVLKNTQELLDGTIALRDKAYRTDDLAALWDVQLMGEKPKGIITRDMFFKQLWQEHYYPKRMKFWNDFYDDQLLKYMEFAKAKPEMAGLFDKANLTNMQLQQRRNHLYNPKGIFTRPPLLNAAEIGSAGNASNIRVLGVTYGYGTDDKHLLNAINKYAPPKTGSVPDAELLLTQPTPGLYTRLEDVPPDIAEKIFSEKTGQLNKYFVKKLDDVNWGANEKITEGLPVPPPRDPSLSPGGHVWAENKDGALGALDHIRQGIRERAGLSVQTGSNKMALKELMPDIVERMSVVDAKSKFIANKWRDFALLPYGEKTNLDLAMGMVYPYQFWYSRSYKNWMTRAFATNPEIISRYANVKEAMANEQRDLPDWWKSQLNVSKVLGINTEHPMYINLEAAVFPLYGLTGTDFNDPQKRVNWWTATLDDMGKFGPSIYAPIQWATAAYFLAKGEKEVSALWGSRISQASAMVKTASSFFGTPIEIDPMVQMFSGDHLLDFKASDPYEEGRITRALAGLNAPQEALIEAARTHSGELWDEAYRQAVLQRAPGQISSFFLGTGFKIRTEEDIQIDRFYADYYRMKNLHDGGYMTDDQYRLAFDKMRQTYPFMDTVLLSRRAGDGRDSAYAYNVMNRIPPGMSGEFYDVVGIDKETAQKFYDSGGKLSVMSKTEQAVFINKMIDLGAMLKIPSNATRSEWTQARLSYNGMQDQITQIYGADIQDKISRYFSFDDMNAAREYLKNNPDVEQAMDARTSMIMSSPNLMKFYGGIETIEKYYTGQMYDQLEKEFGADIFATQDEYYALLDTKERKAFRKEHPELADMWGRKAELQDENLRKIVEFGKYLPESPQPELTGKTPENPTETKIQEFVGGQETKSFQQWQQELGAPMTDLIQSYWYDDEELPSPVSSALDFAAEQYGYENGEEMLQAILMSLPER